MQPGPPPARDRDCAPRERAITRYVTDEPPPVDCVLAEPLPLGGYAGLGSGAIEGPLGDPRPASRSLDLLGGQLTARASKKVPQPLDGLFPLGLLVAVFGAEAAEQVVHGAFGLPGEAEPGHDRGALWSVHGLWFDDVGQRRQPLTAKVVCIALAGRVIGAGRVVSD